MRKNIHITRRQNSHWAVIKEDAERASKLFLTQTKALEFARPRAQKDHVELVIHGLNNRIRDKDSYGPDPCPPRDKKF